MKKQQLLALLMAGTIVTGMAPAAVFGEAGTDAVTIEETQDVSAEAEEGEPAAEPVQAEESIPAEDTTQTPAAEPTEAPAAEPAADPAAATDTPAAEPTEAPETTPSEIFEDATQTDAQTQAEDSGESAQTETGKIYIRDAAGNLTEQTGKTLAQVINESPANTDGTENSITQIVISGTVEISDTVAIAEKRNISIAAGSADATIKRASGFKGDMFKVTGGSSFQFGTASDSTSGEVYPLTVDGAQADNSISEGSMILVETDSNLGVSTNVNLINNHTNAQGAVIRNMGGTVALSGGNIADNQCDADGGAIIYNEGNLLVQGTIAVADDTNDRAIVLANNSSINVVGELSGTSVRFHVADPADGRAIVQVSNNVMSMADALAQLIYVPESGEKYTVDAATGKLTVPTTPVKSTMKIEVVKANGEGVSWTSDTEALVKFHATELGKYYVAVVKQTDKIPTFEEAKANAGKSVKTGDVGTSAGAGVPLTGLNSATDYYVVIYGEDGNGLESANSKVLPLKAQSKEEPDNTPTPTTRAPLTPKVSESTVKGLEKPLAFYPGKTYSFTVTGAGSDNKNPVKGDVRWVPLYWSSYSDPKSSQRQAIGTIGHKTGIKRAATFNMYIFFQKYTYDGTQWQATDIVESMTYKFSSKEITFTVTPSGTITPTATDGNGGSGGYDYGGGGDDSGDGDDSSDPENHDGDDSDTGSSSATNARTADNSPIATMMMLASLSLIAGGYVLVRKRKKEI